MSVQPGKHVSSSTTRRPVELQYGISQDDARRRPAAAVKSLPPSRLNTNLQKAESQTICDGPLPTTVKLGRVFSLPRLRTNTNKSRENIPVIPTQCDGIVVRRKRLVRHPSRHFTSMSTSAQIFSAQPATPFTSTLPQPPSMCVTDTTPKRPTNKPYFAPAISVGDEMDEETNDPAAHYQKIRQLQMARLAKLTRHLGEEIPPELVLSSTLQTDIAESRSLAGSISIDLKDQDSTTDFQSAPASPSSHKLRKSRSLQDAERILRLQTHSEHAVNIVQEKLPYALHPPRTEEIFLQRCIAASLRGSDDVGHSPISTQEAPYGSQKSLYPPPPSESVAQVSSYSELEVDVQISKRTRFWRMTVGKDVLQSVSPDDVAKQLREMKVSP
ncbi:hypothetical protein EDD22DRAFT_859216 [Suillus occidentalis]|nr:hypothetical protein EDD22DRAFT_859216 [Suillus occidentalis]